MQRVVCVLAYAAACVSASPARTLAETLSKLQQVAFEDPATGDAIVQSLRQHAPSFHTSFASIPEYPFAEQSAYQASSPDVIHINFDMPRGASFLQDNDAIGSLMGNYKKIGEIVGAAEKSQTLSDSDIRNAVARANEGGAGNGGAACPECEGSFHTAGLEAAAAQKPVLEVRLAAPKVAPWESLISGLVHQREQLEAKYMTMFRQLFDKKFSKRSSFLQKSGSDVHVKVGAMQQVDPALVSMVVEGEAKRNQQELAMLKSAIAALQSVSGDEKAAFLQTLQSSDFDIKVGQGSRPFERFYDAVRNMETLRRASEERIRSHIASMMARI